MSNLDFESRANLLCTVLRRLPAGYWYRVQCCDDSIKTIADGAGICQQDMHHLLLSNNLINLRGDSNYHLKVDGIESFAQAHSSVEINSSRGRERGADGKHRQAMYLCRCHPLFPTPDHQNSRDTIDVPICSELILRGLRRELDTMRHISVVEEVQLREQNKIKREAKKRKRGSASKSTSPQDPPVDVRAITPPSIPTNAACEGDIEQQVNYALALDLERRSSPRMRQSRSGDGEIPIHDRKQADEHARLHIMFTASMWGYCDKAYSHVGAKATNRQGGMSVSFVRLRLCRLHRTKPSQQMAAQDAELGGTGHANPLQSQHKGSTAYTDKIETNAPRLPARHVQVLDGCARGRGNVRGTYRSHEPAFSDRIRRTLRPGPPPYPNVSMVQEAGRKTEERVSEALPKRRAEGSAEAVRYRDAGARRGLHSRRPRREVVLHPLEAAQGEALTSGTA